MADAETKLQADINHMCKKLCVAGHLPKRPIGATINANITSCLSSGTGSIARDSRAASSSTSCSWLLESVLPFPCLGCMTIVVCDDNS